MAVTKLTEVVKTINMDVVNMDKLIVGIVAIKKNVGLGEDYSLYQLVKLFNNKTLMAYWQWIGLDSFHKIQCVKNADGLFLPEVRNPVIDIVFQLDDITDLICVIEDYYLP